MDTPLISPASAVPAWEPRVKNFAPDIGHDCGGRLTAAGLDR